ncbi:MAG: metal-dependent hydrolase [Prosthecobacter sp.]
MHIPTHILSGWCLADTLELTPRERMLAMVAASAADLDGLGLFVSVEFYAEYHHVLGHNLLAGMLLSAGLAALASKPHRLKMFCLALVLFHLHLVLDYYGSGPGWGFEYLWPLADLHVECEHAWELASWQNFLAFGILLAWTGIIFVRRRRTPLEVICPSLDARAVRRLPK